MNFKFDGSKFMSCVSSIFLLYMAYVHEGDIKKLQAQVFELQLQEHHHG